MKYCHTVFSAFSVVFLPSLVIAQCVAARPLSTFEQCGGAWTWMTRTRSLGSETCSCLDAVQCVQLSGQVEARAVERGVACGDEKDCNGKWRIGPLLCYRGKGGQAT